MHYGSVAAVHCLALWGVDCQCESPPMRHLNGANHPHRHKFVQIAAAGQDGAANMAASERCEGEINTRPLTSSSYEAEASAMDQHSSLVSVCPPKSLTCSAWTESSASEPWLRWMCRCLRQIGAVMPSRCWPCVCVYVWLSACVQVWCSGLVALQQWLSSSSPPTVAPVCPSALLTCALSDQREEV